MATTIPPGTHKENKQDQENKIEKRFREAKGLRLIVNGGLSMLLSLRTGNDANEAPIASL